MAYQWPVGTSDCDSRFGDVTGTWSCGPEDTKLGVMDFPDPDRRPFFLPLPPKPAPHRAPTRQPLPPSLVTSNLDDFGAFLVLNGAQLDSTHATDTRSTVITAPTHSPPTVAPTLPIVSNVPQLDDFGAFLIVNGAQLDSTQSTHTPPTVATTPTVTTPPTVPTNRPLIRVNVKRRLRLLREQREQRDSSTRVESQQRADDETTTPRYTPPITATPTLTSIASSSLTSTAASFTSAAPMSPTRPPQLPPINLPINLPNLHTRRAAHREHLAAVRRAELASAQPATRSPRWPRIRDPDRLSRILRRDTPSPARDPLEQLASYFDHRRAIRLSLATGLCPVEPSDEKAPVAVPELTAGLHPVDDPVAPVELPATLNNHFDSDSAFIAELDSSPVYELEAPPAAKPGFLSRVKSAVRSGLLWLAELFD